MTDTMVKCPICFGWRFPIKILRCGHSYCFCCLVGVHNRDRTSSLICPICRNWTELPTGGLWNLPTNFALEQAWLHDGMVTNGVPLESVTVAASTMRYIPFYHVRSHYLGQTVATISQTIPSMGDFPWSINSDATRYGIDSSWSPSSSSASRLQSEAFEHTYNSTSVRLESQRDDEDLSDYTTQGMLNSDSPGSTDDTGYDDATSQLSMSTVSGVSYGPQPPPMLLCRHCARAIAAQLNDELSFSVNMDDTQNEEPSIASNVDSEDDDCTFRTAADEWSEDQSSNGVPPRTNRTC